MSNSKVSNILFVLIVIVFVLSFMTKAKDTESKIAKLKVDITHTE